MAWTAVVTNAGARLLADWSGGGELEITSARGGTSRVDEALLMAQTNVTGNLQIQITKSAAVTGGMKFELLITAFATAQNIAQIGVFASLDGGSETLLAIYQCGEGGEINVPSASEMPDFAYGFSAIVAMDNTGTLTVNVDSTALVSQAQLAYVDARVEDLEAMGDPVDVLHGGTRATTAKAARANLGTSLKFTAENATWAGVYALLSDLATEETVAFHAQDSDAAGLLTGNASIRAMVGVVCALGSGSYKFAATTITSGEPAYLTWRITGLTSSAATPTVGTVYKNSAALGDPVAIAHGGTGAMTAPAARTNLSAAATFALSSSAWSGLYATLNTLEQGQGAIYRSVAAASQTLVGLNSMMWGTVARLNATVFEFMARTADGANLYMWRVTFSSDGTSATVGNKYVQTFSAVT